MRKNALVKFLTLQGVFFFEKTFSLTKLRDMKWGGMSSGARNKPINLGFLSELSFGDS